MTSPIAAVDAVIHAPKRLAAMAILDATESVSFSFLREHLQLADPDLSKNMSALQAAGYVRVAKSGRGRGSTTTYTMTRSGRQAYHRHRAALIAMLDAPGAPP
jgi:DNA-binding transcriptional ArsR family regulator